jgi:hypothetical protein
MNEIKSRPLERLYAHKYFLTISVLRTWIRRIRKLLGLPDPLVRGTTPSIIKQKQQEKL